jgi:hypothetical protein
MPLRWLVFNRIRHPWRHHRMPLACQSQTASLLRHWSWGSADQLHVVVMVVLYLPPLSLRFRTWVYPWMLLVACFFFPSYCLNCRFIFLVRTLHCVATPCWRPMLCPCRGCCRCIAQISFTLDISFLVACSRCLDWFVLGPAKSLPVTLRALMSRVVRGGRRSLPSRSLSCSVLSRIFRWAEWLCTVTAVLLLLESTLSPSEFLCRSLLVERVLRRPAISLQLNFLLASSLRSF